MGLQQLVGKLDRIERASLEQWIPVLKSNFGFSEQEAWEWLQNNLTKEEKEKYKKIGLEIEK